MTIGLTNACCGGGGARWECSEMLDGLLNYHGVLVHRIEVTSMFPRTSLLIASKVIQLKGRNPQWESLMVPTVELPRGQKVRKFSKQSSCKLSFQAQMSPSPSSEELAGSCLLPMPISWPFLYVMFPSVSDCPESSLQSFSRTSFSPLGSSLVWAKRGSRKPPPEGTSSGIWSHIWQNLGKCLLPTIEVPCLR